MQHLARDTGPKDPFTLGWLCATTHRLTSRGTRRFSRDTVTGDGAEMLPPHRLELSHLGFDGKTCAKGSAEAQGLSTSRIGTAGAMVQSPSGSGMGLTGLLCSPCYSSHVHTHTRTHIHAHSSCLPPESAHCHGNSSDIRHC